MNYTVRIKGKTEEKTSDVDDLKIQDVLDEMELSSETIVSKINGEIVIEDSLIEDGDEVEFIQIIYGLSGIHSDYIWRMIFRFNMQLFKFIL